MSGTEPSRCNYIVPKKSRRCRMLVKKGETYCKEHSMNPRTRVPCPNDPTHSVEASNLKKHLLFKCNSRLMDDPWIKKDFNLPHGNLRKEFVRPSEDAILGIVAIIRRVYSEIEGQIHEIQYGQTYTNLIADQTEVTSQKKTRHLIQFGSIIDHLKAHNLLHNRPDTCLIDLGSGKAQLIYWLAKQAPRCRFLLIDRMGSRNKFDNKARNDDPSLRITRLRCSIDHLDLAQVPIIQECKDSVTAVCKHFCGNAMDAGIRCIGNAIKTGIRFDGFALYALYATISMLATTFSASCCHHKCTKDEYVGLEYLSSIGIQSDEDFSALRHISTWSNCCFRPCDPVEQTDMNTEKLDLGRKAKKIFEYGRALYLKQFGYQVNLYKYVEFEVSPENLLVVGHLDNSE